MDWTSSEPQIGMGEILERKQVNVVRDMLTQRATNVMRSKVEPMKEMAKMIRGHFDGIVALDPDRT